MGDTAWVPSAAGLIERPIRGVDAGDGETAYVGVYVEGGSSGGGSGSGGVGTTAAPNVSTIQDGHGGTTQAASVDSTGALLARISSLPGSPAQDGTDATGVAVPTGGAGIRGWLSGIYAKLSGTLAISGTVTVTDSVPLSTTDTNGGTSATGVAFPTGAAGLLGWLSGIYKLLTGTLTISGNVVVTDAVALSTTDTNGGSAATGVNQPTGGAGILGWLSGIYSKISGTIVVQGVAGGVAQPVSDATLEAVVSGGKLLVSDSTLDAIVSGGKLPVTDATLETVVSGGKLLVSDAALEALITGGKLAVSDALLEALITGGKLAVVDAGLATILNAKLGATSYAAIAAGAAAAAAKAVAGTLYGIVITTQGSAQMTITDGPGGAIIAVVPVNQPVGDLPLYGDGRSFATSLYVNSGAGSPAVTILYS